MSNIPHPPPSAKVKSGHTTQPSSSGEDIHRKLRNFRLREIYKLAHNPTHRRSALATGRYLDTVLLETARYIRFVFWTWWGLAATTVVGGLGPFDWFSQFVYAFGGTVVLFFVLINCLIFNTPFLNKIYFWFSDRLFNGLGLVNNTNPWLFESLTPEQVRAAKKYLSMPFPPPVDTRCPDLQATKELERTFNFDAAKLLLQFSAVVYEHSNQGVRHALLVAAKADAEKFDDLDGETLTQLEEILFSNRDEVIHEFSRRVGVEYEPVSELGNTSSAYAAVFWSAEKPDAGSTSWVVVVFKGTQPLEFGEWLSDLNTKMVHIGSQIPGFGRVHLGFKDRVFPEDSIRSGGVSRPCDTISNGVHELAEWLHKKIGGKSVNIWFTGHSLGCATASLVYSSVFLNKEIGAHSELRDTYLFAAPILSDRATAEFFNGEMRKDRNKPRTMWRVTSNGDFVATCLPEFGDYDSITVSANNGFAFAHHGAEIRMRDGSTRANITGNHVRRGTKVHIKSQFDQDAIDEQRAEQKQNESRVQRAARVRRRWSQKIPILGRFIAHGTTFYWDQINTLDVNETAEWAWN